MRDVSQKQWLHDFLSGQVPSAAEQLYKRFAPGMTLGTPIAVGGSFRRLPSRRKQAGASKGATTSFTAPAY